jgi:uncharacterized membrane protein
MSRNGVISAILIAVMAGLSIFAWVSLDPDAQLAVHWNAAGEVDRYGGKAEALLMLPAIAVALSVMLAVAPRIDPRGRNLLRSGPLLTTVWLGTLTLMAVMHTGLVLTALGVFEPDTRMVVRMVLLALSVLLVLKGNAFGKARPNWFIGMRTPWTLSSDRAWDKTHRWVGRGLVLTGLAGGAAAAFAPVQVGLWVIIASLGVTTLGGVLLSFLVWRTDPDREMFSEPS